MKFYKPPFLLRKLFPLLHFSFPNLKKEVFITFDDGPEPEVTKWVLSVLNKFNAKATFFCLGKKVKENPSLYKQILLQGHKTGNHTYNHLNGWKTETTTYLKDTEDTDKLIDSNLFRPPYGKIKFKQIKAINKKYKIIIWDILSYDFKKNIDSEKCLKRLIKHTKSGSIIVFHDTKKSYETLKQILPQYLYIFSQKGYTFKSIE